MVCYTCDPQAASKTLKIEVMGDWMEAEWYPRYPGQALIKLIVPSECIHEKAFAKFDPEYELPGGYRFGGRAPLACSAITEAYNYDFTELTEHTGAFIYHFIKPETGEKVDALVMGSHYSDSGWYMVAMACMPEAFFPVWTAFANYCSRLVHALQPTNHVVIIGGHAHSFVPTVDWDDIVLPEKLKADILQDMQTFFSKGIDIYHRLNLKPFRKLLLAGVPGTGKTMICSALAKWALAQNFLVIYVSSARKRQGEAYGSTFDKIEQALSVASYSSLPTLILLEELDAYLHPEEKALVLNVLDGSEAAINDRGTLLVSTTNYPEAIDERVLKRPGRLDRIFIIPEVKLEIDAEKMLRQYLGDVWRDEHTALVPELVGYPGAFIREVAVYALTQMAYDDMVELPLDMLMRSFQGLKEQIEARDDFLTQRMEANGVPVQANGHAN